MIAQGKSVASEGKSLEEILRQDHDEIEELWDRASASRGKDDRQACEFYRKFVEALDEHIEIEEEFLFPYSQRTRGDEVKHLLGIMQEEHTEIRKLLGKIHAAVAVEKLPSEGDETELRNTLGNHNAREEGLYYPAFDGSFSASPEGAELMRSALHHCSCGKR